MHIINDVHNEGIIEFSHGRFKNDLFEIEICFKYEYMEVQRSEITWPMSYSELTVILELKSNNIIVVWSGATIIFILQITKPRHRIIQLVE